MVIRLVSILFLTTLVVCGSVVAGDEVRVRADEPIQEKSRYRSEVVYHYPYPIELKNLGDRMVYVYFRSDDFKAEDVVLDSVRVHGKIPAYTEEYPKIENGWIVTNCFAFRFLSAYRPIPETVRSTFTVTFDLVSGEHVTLEGQAYIKVPVGDVTLDGYVNEEDLQFLEDYLYNDGRVSELSEMMDVNRDGSVNLLDLEALEEIIYGP